MTAQMRVTLVARTEFLDDAAAEVMSGFRSTGTGGAAAAEAAGRSCYQAFSKARPSTATNEGYIGHILDVGHTSVLEHGQASVYVTGVSRSFSHEVIRHRHLSPSQLSQRFVDESSAEFVEPATIAEDPELHAIFQAATAKALEAYEQLAAGLQRKYADVEDPTLRRKMARQEAREILPNATETRIYLTGNYRAWRHLIDLRATEHADKQIRAFAIQVLRILQAEVPAVFGDYTISKLEDGTEVASSPHVAAA